MVPLLLLHGGGPSGVLQLHPVATNRAFRAILKGRDVCAVDPDRASRLLVDLGRIPREDLMRQVLQDIPYHRWRDGDREDRDHRAHRDNAQVTQPICTRTQRRENTRRSSR
jgi:hypothetical protein